jgi:NAD(P) transhydrogenase subunit beta
MAIAIVGTLMQQTIIDYRWIALGLGVGTVAGIPLGTRVPMTAMPQRIAIALTFGASPRRSWGSLSTTTTAKRWR